jgi:hypothetical protein
LLNKEEEKEKGEEEEKRMKKRGRGTYWRISSIDIFAALESEWVDSVRISSTLALISNSSGTIWVISCVLDSLMPKREGVEIVGKRMRVMRIESEE